MVGFLDELGLERVHVGGNSLGGWVGLELARLGRARSVTALSPAGFWNERERRFVHASLWSTVRLARAMRPVVGPLTATAPARTLLSGQMFARPWRIPPHEMAANVRALADAPAFDATLRAMSAAAPLTGGVAVDCAVTIAWAQRDRLLLPREARRAARAIPGARLVVLTGCGHVPTWDDPEQVARVLLEGSAPRV